jgi:hypothetical protein
MLIILASQVGFEPTTLRLTAKSSNEDQLLLDAQQSVSSTPYGPSTVRGLCRIWLDYD